MGRLKLIMVVAGAVLVLYGYEEWRLSGEVKAEPQTISCAALTRDGYGDDAHVRLTDFLVSPSSFVYEEAKGGGVVLFVKGTKRRSRR